MSTNSKNLGQIHALRIFIPRISEAALLLSLSSLSLFLINSFVAIRYVEELQSVDVSGYLSLKIDELLRPLSSETSTQILYMLFWVFIGIGAYLITWILVIMIQTYLKDLPPLSHYIVPKGVNQKILWYHTIGRLFLRLFSSIILVAWIFFLLRHVLPYTSEMFIYGLRQTFPANVYNIISSITVLSAGSFMGIVFLRCIFLRERVFET